MAAKQMKKTKKPPLGPHPLTLAGERGESRAMEKKESPAFERAERAAGIEGKYGPMKKKAKKQSRGK